MYLLRKLTYLNLTLPTDESVLAEVICIVALSCRLAANINQSRSAAASKIHKTYFYRWKNREANLNTNHTSQEKIENVNKNISLLGRKMMNKIMLTIMFSR